jgi:hypothetical protein
MPKSVEDVPEELITAIYETIRDAVLPYAEEGGEAGAAATVLASVSFAADVSLVAFGEDGRRSLFLSAIAPDPKQEAN